MSDPLSQYVTAFFTAEPADGRPIYLDHSYTSHTHHSTTLSVADAPTGMPGAQSLDFRFARFLVQTSPVNYKLPRLAGAADCCIEVTIYPTEVSGDYSICARGTAASPLFRLAIVAGQLQLLVRNAANTAHYSITGGTIAENQRYRLCVERVGTTLSLYCEGELVGTATLASGEVLYNTDSYLTVWGASAGFTTTASDSLSNLFVGYMDEIRVTSGAYRYGGAYTPSDARFPMPTIASDGDDCLFFESTNKRGVVMTLKNCDTGSNYITFDRGICSARSTINSGYPIVAADAAMPGGKALRGFSGYVEVATATHTNPTVDFYFETDDFFADAFVRPPGAASTGPLFWLAQTGSTQGIGVTIQSNPTRFALTTSLNTTEHIAGLATYRPYHLMMHRRSGTLRLYVDGCLAAEVAGVTTNLTQQYLSFFYGRGGATLGANAAIASYRHVCGGVPSQYWEKFKRPTQLPVAYEDHYDQCRNYTVLAMPLAMGKNPIAVFDYLNNTFTDSSAGYTMTSYASAQMAANEAMVGGGPYKMQWISVPHAPVFDIDEQDFCFEVTYSRADTTVWNQFVRVGGGTSATNRLQINFSVVAGQATYFTLTVVYYDAAGTATTLATVNNLLGRDCLRVAVVRKDGVSTLYRWTRTSQASGGAFPTTTNLGTGVGSILGVPGQSVVMLSNVAGFANFSNLRLTVGHNRYPDFFEPMRPLPSQGVEAISGVVLDADGNPISRPVLAYHRGNRKLIAETVSDPVTGAFVLPTYGVYKHMVMVLDEEKNALVYDHVMPVAYP